MPIILVLNEETEGGKYNHWEDIVGVQHHFPNQYKNKVIEGEQFIYYRGSRRLNSKKSTPEYFGFGRIGRIWLDPNTDITKPKRNWYWYCEIIDYIPFKKPILFKNNDETFEKIARNLWGVIRSLPGEIFNSILKTAKIKVVNNEPIINNQSPVIPKIEDVNPSTDDNLLLSSPSLENTSSQSRKSGSKSTRRSKYAKLYGDHSEKIVFTILTKKRVYNLRLVAKEKPGWDIEYHDNNNLIAVEVKGTSGKKFLNIEITAREWDAAKEKGPHYNLYLIADCLSNQPKMQIINNPYALYLKKQLKLEPLIYRITKEPE